MIFFRADGNAIIGAGHIMRCLSIAESALELGNEVYFYTAGNEFSETIRNKKIKNKVLHTDFKQLESELTLFVDQILLYKPSIVIVDSYFVTRRYLWSLMESCHSYGGKVVYIDDIIAFAYPCDYLINYNIYAPDKKQDYLEMYESAGIKKSADGFPEMLLGLDYVPLRKEFFAVSHNKTRDKIKDVLVSTGGADLAHIALAIVKELISKHVHDIGNLKFHIVIGVMNEDKDEIEGLAYTSENIEVYYNIQDMLGLMEMCDVAISAAGSTLYELCATHTPTITYVVADNQILGAEEFAKRGIMEYVGDVRVLGTENLAVRLIDAVKNITVKKNMIFPMVAKKSSQCIFLILNDTNKSGSKS